MIQHSESSKFFEDITRTTGMSNKEIQENLSEKSKILSWMIANDVRDLQSMGKVMNAYYSNKSFLLDAIKKNNKGFLK